MNISGKMTALALSVMVSTGVSVLARQLPIVEIVGGKYYVYEVKKGDSLYGIAKECGWNVDSLLLLNPITAKALEKGSKLYYPVENRVVQSQTPITEKDVEYAEPVRHVVKRGETVYGIARMYDTPVDLIYSLNPSSRKGLREGDVIELKQPDKKNEGEKYYVYYNVKQGDTLYKVARDFSTSVEAILKENPGVSEHNFRAGSQIRIAQGKDERKRVVKEVEKVEVVAVDNYKVEKNDTWDTISAKTGVSRSELEASNGNWHKLKKNETIAVPRTDTLRYTEEVIFEDPRENSSEGIADIYEETHNIAVTDAEKRKVSLAYVCMEPSQRRDVEFSRGALTALDYLRGKGYEINFSILDGTKTSTDVIDLLSEKKPDILFSTSEKGIPAYLAEYAEISHTPLVNVFDVKSDAYNSNPYIIQYLTPSNIFNEKTASWLSENFKGRNLIIVGNDNEDEQDTFSALLRSGMEGSPILTLSPEEFADYPFSDDISYLVFVNLSKKDDVLKALSKIEAAKLDAPLAEVSVIGKPNWVVFSDQLADKFYQADVYMPSRFYLDLEDLSTKSFISRFKALFEHGPMKSYPLYAGTAYDLFTYFVPALVDTGKDLNRANPSTSSLQMDLNMQRAGNWSGFYNQNAYIIHFAPYQMADKIVL